MIEVEEQNTTDSASRDVAVNELASHLGVRAERGRRFAELTSLRVGGAIDWVLSPLDETAAAALVHELDQREIAWRALGSGSNVLADDGEHHYVIVSLKELKANPIFNGNTVSVSAGYSLPRLCIEAARQGLSGIEGLNGIPGTVGGALWMNAGAFGQEIGTVVDIVWVAREGRVTEIPGAEVKWNYRHTSFREGELLLGATLILRKDDVGKIQERMAEAKGKRMSSQPHGARSAGCFFKNPPDSIGTGKMIDELGFKGSRRGGAVVSEKHANFIVTEGENAKASHALELAEEIRERVKREHGIDLEYEVEVWRSESEPGAGRGPRAGSPRGVVDATGLSDKKDYDPNKKES